MCPEGACWPWPVISRRAGGPQPQLYAPATPWPWPGDALALRHHADHYVLGGRCGSWWKHPGLFLSQDHTPHGAVGNLSNISSGTLTRAARPTEVLPRPFAC